MIPVGRIPIPWVSCLIGVFFVWSGIDCGYYNCNIDLGIRLMLICKYHELCWLWIPFLVKWSFWVDAWVDTTSWFKLSRREASPSEANSARQDRFFSLFRRCNVMFFGCLENKRISGVNIRQNWKYVTHSFRLYRYIKYIEIRWNMSAFFTTQPPLTCRIIIIICYYY